MFLTVCFSETFAANISVSLSEWLAQYQLANTAWYEVSQEPPRTTENQR